MEVMTKASLESESQNTDNYMKIFVSVYTHRYRKTSMSALGKKPNPNQKWQPTPLQKKNQKQQKEKPKTKRKQTKQKINHKNLKCILKRLIGKDPQKFWQNTWLLLLQAQLLNESLLSNFFLAAWLELQRSKVSWLNCFWSLDLGFMWLVLTSE